MWFKDVLFIKDNDILRRKGRDGLQYLVFQRYMIYFLALLTVICLAIVLPVNMQGKGSNYYIKCLFEYTFESDLF